MEQAVEGGGSRCASARRIAVGRIGYEHARDDQAQAVSRDKQRSQKGAAAGLERMTKAPSEEDGQHSGQAEICNLNPALVAKAEVADLQPNWVVSSPRCSLNQESGDEQRRTDDSSPERQPRDIVPRTANHFSDFNRLLRSR